MSPGCTRAKPLREARSAGPVARRATKGLFAMYQFTPGNPLKRAFFRTVATAALAAASLGRPAPASAQPAPAAPAGGQIEQARTHYERGMQLFKEDNYEAALNEFERAYELAPSYRILDNMARIQRQQNNYAAALQNFQTFLAEGGANVGEERRREVERDVAVLRSRVAVVDVRVNVEGADLYVDDVPVCTGVMGQRACAGKSPLPGPLFVNPGRRKISAVKAGYGEASATVRVVGSDRTNVRLDLRPAAAAGAARDEGGGEGGGGGSGTAAVVAWAGTGAFAAAAVVTGVLTLRAQGDLRDRRDEFVGDRSALDGDAKKVKNLALATDVLGGLAIAGAAVATVFTLRAAGSGPEAPRVEKGAGLRLDVGPTGAWLSGRF